MMIINRKISTQLTVANAYAFAGLSFGKKRDKPKNDSAKYDVVIVGGNLGALPEQPSRCSSRCQSLHLRGL